MWKHNHAGGDRAPSPVWQGCLASADEREAAMAPARSAEKSLAATEEGVTAVSDPTVSVIMAVKNGARFLGAAIDSVLAQELRPSEIVVVDGGSEDDSVSIARSYPAVRVVPQTGTGIASAYNTGIDVTSGDLLAFLSSDDLWTPDKLSAQVGFLRPCPQVQYVTARVRFFLEPGCAVPPGFRRALLEGDHVGHIMETLLARRAVFDLVGRFDPRLSTGEDVDWFARAHDLGVHHAVVERVLLHKRVHDRNLSLRDAESNRNLLDVVKRSLDRKRERFVQAPPNGDRLR